jgi:hypothetical protein
MKALKILSIILLGVIIYSGLFTLGHWLGRDKSVWGNMYWGKLTYNVEEKTAYGRDASMYYLEGDPEMNFGAGNPEQRPIAIISFTRTSRMNEPNPNKLLTIVFPTLVGTGLFGICIKKIWSIKK